MAEYTVKVRRFKPESGDGPYWENFDVELEESLSVLDALLQVRAGEDGSLAVRCSCRAASMLDVTQSMACIQCGACVSSCLSMEADPEFIGPAALAKAYRFVGDPRDSQRRERLYDLAQDPHGIYDCTHCFSCIDACP